MPIPKDKRKFTLWLYPETLDKIGQLYTADDCRSKSEFIEKAVQFYIDHLTAEDQRSMLLCEYKKQTEHRDALKVQSSEVLAEIMAKVNGGTYDNPTVENLLLTLAKRLAVTNGKKQYGYLRYDIKELIDNIVDELGKDERIAALYNLWYEAKGNALTVYSESQPERLPLSQNKEFKSVKNMVIAEAMKLNLSTDEVEEPELTEPDSEPTAEEAESPDPPPPPMDEYERTVADADKGNKWSQYRAAKFMLDRDGDRYDPKKAVEYLTRSAKQGYTVAKYMLGKLYLKGEDVPKQMLHALHWLESAVKDDNHTLNICSVKPSSRART